MRDYLYLWINAQDQELIASGIEFRDIAQFLNLSPGVIALKHQAEEAVFDNQNGFDVILNEDLKGLVKENIYDWGDFVWVDYNSNQFVPKLTDAVICELLYFGHMKKPLKNIHIPEMNNQFMYYGHDDGWFLRLYYTKLQHIHDILRRLLTDIGQANEVAHILETLDSKAYWVTSRSVREVERDWDIDKVQSEYMV